MAVLMVNLTTPAVTRPAARVCVLLGAISSASAVPDRRRGRQSGGRLTRPSDDQLTISRIQGQTQVCDLVVHAVRHGVRHSADWDGRELTLGYDASVSFPRHEAPGTAVPFFGITRSAATVVRERRQAPLVRAQRDGFGGNGRRRSG